jgi:hypothetical protein
MKNHVKILGTVAIVSALAVGCNAAPTDVETGGGNSMETKAEASANVKSFKANVTKEFMGVKVGVAEVKIKPDRVEVGMHYENKSGQSVNWYPDQEAKAVIGDMQLDSNLFIDDAGLTVGDISDGVKSDGVFTFRPAGNKKIDPDKVKEIKLNFGEMNSGDFTKTEKVEFTVKVK